MSPLEAKFIIEALANGIDPETGEIISAQSTFNNPSVIRSLFVAVKALDSEHKRFERAKGLPDNAGRPWAENEDQELLALFDSNASIKDMAEKHARTQGAIASRLVRLGRIKEHGEVQ